MWDKNLNLRFLFEYDALNGMAEYFWLADKIELRWSISAYFYFLDSDYNALLIKSTIDETLILIMYQYQIAICEYFNINFQEKNYKLNKKYLYDCTIN